MIRVGVFGAGGRMGATVCAAVTGASDCALVAAVDPRHAGETVSGTELVVAAERDAIADATANVVVDFTVAEAARENLAWCADHGVDAVVGTTGLTSADVDALSVRFAAAGARALVAPNFAIGAVLMMRFAEMAAPYFETGEIIELHHDRKADAPSGTAMLTARRMADASDDWAEDPTRTRVVDGARGAIAAGGIHVHSVRLRGLVAHQEVILGTTGQSLTIRHDSYDRSSFMPGVLLALARIGSLAPGVTVGLDAILDL